MWWQQPARWEAEEDSNTGGPLRIRVGRTEQGQQRVLNPSPRPGLPCRSGAWVDVWVFLGGRVEGQGSAKSALDSLTSVSQLFLKASKSFPAVLQTSAPIDSIRIVALPHLFSTACHWRSPTLTFSSGSCALCALKAPCW